MHSLTIMTFKLFVITIIHKSRAMHMPFFHSDQTVLILFSFKFIRISLIDRTFTLLLHSTNVVHEFYTVVVLFLSFLEYS